MDSKTGNMVLDIHVSHLRPGVCASSHSVRKAARKPQAISADGIRAYLLYPKEYQAEWWKHMGSIITSPPMMQTELFACTVNSDHHTPVSAATKPHTWYDKKFKMLVVDIAHVRSAELVTYTTVSADILHFVVINYCKGITLQSDVLAALASLVDYHSQLHNAPGHIGMTCEVRGRCTPDIRRAICGTTKTKEIITHVCLCNAITMSVDVMNLDSLFKERRTILPSLKLSFDSKYTQPLYSRGPVAHSKLTTNAITDLITVLEQKTMKENKEDGVNLVHTLTLANLGMDNQAICDEVVVLAGLVHNLILERPYNLSLLHAVALEQAGNVFCWKPQVFLHTGEHSTEQHSVSHWLKKPVYSNDTSKVYYMDPLSSPPSLHQYLSALDGPN